MPAKIIKWPGFTACVKFNLLTVLKENITYILSWKYLSKSEQILQKKEVIAQNVFENKFGEKLACVPAARKRVGLLRTKLACLVWWGLNGFPVVSYVERWKGAEYSDLLGSYPFLNRNHSDNNLLRISDVSTCNIFLKHNQMFQHGSLSPNFERFPFSVFNFSYLIFSYLIHLILSCLALSCLVLHFNALYCIAFSPSLRRERSDDRKYVCASQAMYCIV